MLSAVVIPLSLSAGPIPISGSGTFFSDTFNGIAFWTISFSGSSGASSVNASGIECNGPVLFCLGIPSSPVGVDIDGVHFHPGFFTYTGRSIAGLDDQFQPIVTENLAFVESITSETCVPDIPGSPGPETCTGTFVVTPPASTATPELGALPLTLSGVALVGILMWATKTSTRNVDAARLGHAPHKNDELA